MQQILKETKIKYIYYIENPPYPTYEKNNSKEILITNNLFITNPLTYKSAVQILDRNYLSFSLIGSDINYIEILSEGYFYIRVNGTFILKTKSFNYYNDQDTLQSIELANGTLDWINNALQYVPTSEDVKVEYVIANGI